MSGFRFDIKGLGNLNKALRETPEKARVATKAVLTKHVTEINAAQVQGASRFTDRGSVAQGLGWVPVDEINFLLFSQAPHSAAIEFGTGKKFQSIPGIDASEYRGPWGNKSGKTFYQAIYEWVKRKGIAASFSTGVYKLKGGGFAYDPAKARKKKGGKAEDKKVRQAAYLVYRSILKNGVRPQPFFFTPFLSRKEQIKQDVATAINNLR